MTDESRTDESMAGEGMTDQGTTGQGGPGQGEVGGGKGAASQAMDRPKLPWSQRWALAKRLLLDGTLPANWSDLVTTYRVGKGRTTEAEQENKGRVGPGKDWKAAMEQKHDEYWLFPQERNVWREALRSEWLKLAPTKRCEKLAKTIWQEQIPDSQLAYSWLEWRAVDADRKPTTSMADVEDWTEREKQWLLGWVIAVDLERTPDPGQEKGMAEPNEAGDSRAISPTNLWTSTRATELTGTMSTLEWAIIFNQGKLVGKILDSDPKQMDREINKSNSLYEEALKTIKGQKLSFPLVAIPRPAIGIEPLYQSVWWGANLAMEEICLRGGASLARQGTVGDKVVMQHALEMSNREGMEILLKYNPVVRCLSATAGKSTIKKFVDMFPPHLPGKQEYLTTFRQVVEASTSHPSVKYPVPLEEELVEAMFEVIMQRREPDLLEPLLATFYAAGSTPVWSYQRNLDRKHPSFDPKRQREKINLMDQGWDKGADEYLGKMLDNVPKLTVQPKVFYQTMTCSPLALPALLKHLGAGELGQALDTVPEPYSANHYWDVGNKEESRPRWSKDDQRWWVVLFKSREPAAALRALKGQPEFQQRMTAEVIGECLGMAFRLPPTQMAEAVEELDEIRQTAGVDWQAMAPIKGLTSLMYRDQRSLKVVAGLAERGLIPWHHPIDESGITLTHLVVTEGDEAMFKIAMERAVSFEEAGEFGKTPLEVARQDQPVFYQALVERRREELATMLPEGQKASVDHGQPRL